MSVDVYGLVSIQWDTSFAWNCPRCGKRGVAAISADRTEANVDRKARTCTITFALPVRATCGGCLFEFRPVPDPS